MISRNGGEIHINPCFVVWLLFFSTKRLMNFSEMRGIINSLIVTTIADQQNKEMHYFQNKILSIVYNEQRFRIMFGKDKFLFGLVLAEDNNPLFGKLMYS